MSKDLHCHSNVSDGIYRPSQLAHMVYEHGADTWSLTDHDEIMGLAEARQASESLGLTFINGVEISCLFMDKTVHIVGLGFDDQHEGLKQFLRSIQEDRIRRAKLMAEKLEDLIHIPHIYQGALQYCQRELQIGRVHFARYLTDKGCVEHINEAFDRYLADGKPAYVPGKWASIQEAVSYLKQAGGVAVIAHPGRYALTKMEFYALCLTFKKSGGQGIEVVTGSHRKELYRTYAEIANEWGFYASCGSDYHGIKPYEMMIGKVPALPSHVTPIWKLWCE
ncbi:PHP domain-containing protein [Basilea psittacipulmonis]|uniref:Polymerase/histidinol phosphatase N-terminal domain-containing protein n=1 Tax=Basilea psittacipulmonis DSM 24701 TaxID=1072685 RepID=A0A077DDB2_9BURK|nr:PHP domain-containing protein [Basilea psittacipulmonis]AIL32599.1 hypothetical protein IX83_04105 [Basilea psittacipulmonis DSM 24701]